MQFWTQFKGLVGAELYISNNKDLYHKLYRYKEQIESDLGEKLDWRELPGKKASKLMLVSSADFEDEGKWEQYFDWLLKKAEKLYQVVPRYLKL